MELGARAQMKNNRTWYGRGYNTVEKLITVLAPPSENDTAAYINFVATKMGVKSDQVLAFSPGQEQAFAYWCNVMESGVGNAVPKSVYETAYYSI